MRIVKKTLKGDLLGKTGFKKVAGGKARAPDGSEPGAAAVPAAPEPSKGPDVKPRGQASLDDLVPNHDDLVIVTEPLHPRHGKPIPIGNALPPAPPRVLSPEERQAMSEAEADLAATNIGVTQSPGGRRGNVAQVRDGGAPVAIASQPPTQAAPVLSKPAPAPQKMASGTRLESDAVVAARGVIAEALFRAFGAPGSKMQHPRGGSFHVQPRFGEGIVRTQHDLLLPLPAGHVAPHTADLVIELEPVGLLVLDIVPSHVTLTDLKARAFDALQMRRIDRCFSVLVYIRCPGAGMAQGQAEAVAHGYDFTFGIDEEHIHSEAKFGALRTRVTTWLEAASAANRGR